MSRSWEELRELPVVEWTPQQQLRPAESVVERAAVPAIDIHNHLGRWLTDDHDWMIDDPAALIEVMDAANVATVVNLDGLWGDEVTANVERYDRAYPGRFLTFCQLEWARLEESAGLGTHGGGDSPLTADSPSVLADPIVRELIASLDDSAARGARGVKVWKNLGLTFRDASGALVLPDDPRVIAVLRHAGELGLPVLIHTADPKAFFAPLDEKNERLDELLVMKEWWFGDTEVYPSFDRLLAAHAALVAGAPGTRFIGAHFGCAAEDLDLVERMLAASPNYTVDIAGRMAELGRQPRRLRALLERFPDRVHFGTDIYPATLEQYRLHFRFLETLDEAFSYAPESDVPPQGRWTVSALGLPPELLARVYRDNAARVLGLA
ncbi:amidohydrolase family protein [Schumannella soli]|uniref:Amidohydrolase family protein n=1 Tax=Schumannella soli TaxID=2590779 RepID=A0A506XPU0_9MICO|nr:amidohydrolase family protein [Schumannella soli]TPW74651.1 amidohydrolase family protein [Schumannella soli]